MDDLYGDLENYNEVCNAEELRNENKDLKLKLEEYATAMGKLQKDYDKLTMEFHTLQMNYSSLLKTARAEVERKSQMITQLNIEKDMMVMQALQNGNKRPLHNRNNFQKSVQNPKIISNVDNRTSSKGNNQNNVKKDQIQKSADIKNERCETSSMSTNVSVPSTENTQLLNIVDKVVQKVDACINKGELKENIPHIKPEGNAPKTCANSIMNRRKSMPAVSFPKFSSDDDSEVGKPTKQITRNETQQHNVPDTKNMNTVLTRISNERLSNKTSETSSADGRSSTHQELARDDYRNRSNRHHDNDKYKTNDRFRETDRFRGFDRYRGTGRSDRYRESDMYRESDKLRETERFRDGDRHRESDKYRDNDKYRSDKFRDSEKYRDGDKYGNPDRNREMDKYRCRDRYDSTQRYRRHSPDRPLKRLYREYHDDYHRSEQGRHRVVESPPPETNNYQNKSQEHWSRYERYGHESDKYKPRCEERFVGQYPTSSDNDEPNSKRQKVDVDTKPEANRKHEDPVSRLSSTEVHEFEMLRTSCQSPDAAFSPTYSDTTPMHTIKEIKNVAVTPLEDPRLTSKKYVLQTDHGKNALTTAISENINIKPIDKSLWNIESVTVPEALLHKPQQQFNDEHIKEIYMDIDNADNNVPVESDNMVYNSVAVPGNNNRGKETEDASQSNTQIQSTEVLSMEKHNQKNTAKSNYKIPKVKQNTQGEHSSVPSGLPKITCDNVKPLKDRHLSIQRQSLPCIDKHDGLKPASSANKVAYESKKEKCEERRITLSDIAMVHDDLELSDENSDNADLHKKITEKISEPNTKPSMELKTANKSSFKIRTNENVDSRGINATVDDKPKDSDGQKKQKNKRRKTRSKEIELGEGVDVIQTSEKKTRSKKEKDKPKAIKSKFTDLFGESSSLITPEDLGIPATCVPLCEDAQDAVDININEVVKAPPTDISAAKHTTKKNIDIVHEGTSHSTTVDDPNTEDRQIAKRIEAQIASPAINIAYQNLNSEAEINKPDVVQTVIISSGRQPQFVLEDNQGSENRIAGVEVNIQNMAECNQLPAIMGLKKQNYMQALATSTPHKDFSTPKEASKETDSRMLDSCNHSKAESTDTRGHSMDQSDTNTQEAGDAPDVRIFVRRRRKGVKRT